MSSTTIVTDESEIDAKPSTPHSAFNEISLSHPSSTEEVRLSTNDYNNLDNWLDAADRLNVPVVLLGN